jgi:hypothetical protein
MNPPALATNIFLFMKMHNLLDTRRRSNSFLNVLFAIRIWILLSTLVVSAGWILSAFHQLNGIGYAISFALAAIAFVVWQRQTQWRPRANPAQLFNKFRRRFRRIVPMLFLALAVLTLLGGALYAPVNGSTNQYRIPRVMFWLAAGHWQWIRTFDVRINVIGCDFEWLFPPLILLTHNDRWLFLLNWIPYLMLPGLIFSVFTRLGVRRRVAWWWMWILPSGWCYITQAGSTINDAVGAVYALAAVDFALRARENKSIGDLWLAMLSLALVTGVKQTNIPLVLPGLIAMLPVALWLLKRPVASLAVIAACLLVSFVPTTILNLDHTGNWVGMPVNSAQQKVELRSPLWGIIGNTFALAAQNLKPPVFPFFKSWNNAMIHFLQTPFGAHFNQFENFGHLTFGAGEDAAPLGLGIVLLILISFFAARHYSRLARTAVSRANFELLPRLLRWTPWLLLLVFMAKNGAYGNARYLASYYLFLFPSLLVSSGQPVLIRRRWWQWCALPVMALAVMLVVVSRDRPLFPVQTIIGRLETIYPNSKFISNVGHTYAETPDYENLRSSLMEKLPSDVPLLGYASFGGLLGSSLWLPYGQRHVEYILTGDTPEQIRAAGIHYAVVESAFLDYTNVSLDQWLARYNAVVDTQWQFVANPYLPPEKFYLVHLLGP